MLSPVLLRLSKGFVIVALTLSLGAHWAFLQSVAWAGMLYSYSQQAGLAQAVSMTFDGDHPCALCKSIQKARTAERQEKQENVKPATELKLDLPPMRLVLNHPPQPRLLWVGNPAPLSPTQAPELPPPRSV